jgi:predicted hotdog family 3-hydroxylacyl-ACP dehydratase
MINPNIKTILPHREPFIMVDDLVMATIEQFETSFTICADNIFLDAEGFSQYGMIENIAQSCALGMNRIKVQTKHTMMNGYLSSVTKLKVIALPQLHDELITKVYPIYTFENMYLYKGENYIHHKKIMECEIKLVKI